MALGKKIIEVTTIIIVFVPVLLLATRVGAQSNCASAILSLSPCLSFNVGNSSSSPSSACCSQLTSLVQSTPLCLCDVMNNGSGAEVLGLVIDRSLAQALPKACNVETSSLGGCYNGIGSQSGDGAGGAYSEGNKLKIPLLLAIFLVFIASYAPIFRTTA